MCGGVAFLKGEICECGVEHPGATPVRPGFTWERAMESSCICIAKASEALSEKETRVLSSGLGRARPLEAGSGDRRRLEVGDGLGWAAVGGAPLERLREELDPALLQLLSNRLGDPHETADTVAVSTRDPMKPQAETRTTEVGNALSVVFWRGRPHHGAPQIACTQAASHGWTAAYDRQTHTHTHTQKKKKKGAGLTFFCEAQHDEHGGRRLRAQTSRSQAQRTRGGRAGASLGARCEREGPGWEQEEGGYLGEALFVVPEQADLADHIACTAARALRSSEPASACPESLDMACPEPKARKEAAERPGPGVTAKTT
eukprot:3123889-Rhodomonas_salina.2